MTECVFEIDESRADALGNMPCERREEIIRCRDCAHAFKGDEIFSGQELARAHKGEVFCDNFASFGLSDMPTDDERRAVAARLREIDAERLDRVYGMDGEDGECEDPGVANAGRDLMLGAIAEAVGMHFAPYYFDAAPLRDRLADLIEPDCGTGETASSRVLECDRDALLALADDVDGAVKDAGDAWPLADALHDIARCIREACGEVER